MSVPPRPDWNTVDDLFQRALDVPPEARVAFVRAEAGEDAPLRLAVESLLDAVEEAPDFLETPPAGAAEITWGAVLGIEGPAPEAGEDESLPDRVGQRLGPWRLLSRIGRGGMATVYLAERVDGQWEQRVAAKVLRRGIDTRDVIRRFLAERQILSSLQHPNISRLLDGGSTEDGLPYLIMELVSGRPIDVYCEERNLPIDDRLRLFNAVGRAVQYAHGNLVVHRDIKPSNILVTDEGEAKLLDFGIAKLLDEGVDERTRTGRQVLTPQYASPEQVRGEAITTASDVYQLGLLLCTIVAGRPPYRVAGGSRARIEEDITRTEPTRPSRLVEREARDGAVANGLSRRLAGDIDTIVLKALRKDPGERYETAEAMVADVERHLAGHPILAEHATRAYRFRKWLGRHRAGATAAAAGVLLLLGWAVTTTVQSRLIARERDRARAEATRAVAVRDFLVDLFDMSNPYRSGTSPDSLTARELLDDGASRLAVELDHVPLERAELAHAIGRTYAGMGVPERAGPLLEESLALHSRVEGEESEAVARDLLQLASLRLAGVSDSTIGLLDRALRIAEATVGPDDPLTGEILLELGTVLALVANPDAERFNAMYDRAIAIFRGDAPGSRGDLAQALITSSYGRPERQEERMSEALAILRELHGEEHPLFANALSDMGLMLEPTDPLRADSLMRESLRILEATVGPRGTTLIIMNNLAGLRRDRGDWAGAAELYERLLALRKTPQGRAYTQYGLGLTRLEQGRRAEAEDHLRGALRTLTEEFGTQHATVVIASTTLGRCLREQGRLDEAEALLLGVREEFARGAIVPPSFEADVLEELVRLYETMGRDADRRRMEDELEALEG